MKKIEINDVPKNLYGTCFRENNLCLICQGKTDEYRKNPVSVWDKIPEECKLSGWIFLQQEEVKQKIRRKKEKILSLRTKLDGTDGIKRKRILKDIEKYQKEVNVYKDFGSEMW